MRQARQGLQWWVLGSAALMAVGAFGPWVKALGQSVGGTDGSNDGWLVVAAAVIGACSSTCTRTQRAAGVWALLGGIAGTAVTLYDRSNVQDAINKGGAFAHALVQVGWGLNLAPLRRRRWRSQGRSTGQARAAAANTTRVRAAAPPNGP